MQSSSLLLKYELEFTVKGTIHPWSPSNSVTRLQAGINECLCALRTKKEWQNECLQDMWGTWASYAIFFNV